MCSWGKHLMTYRLHILIKFRLKPRLLVCEQIRKTHQSCLLKLWFWLPPTNVAFFGHLVEDGGGSETLAILISLRHGRRRHWSQWWRWLTWQTSHNMIAGGGVAGIWDGMLKVRYTIYNCFNICGGICCALYDMVGGPWESMIHFNWFVCLPTGY